jgi:Spy/CpxP family protein refolding chaperone
MRLPTMRATLSIAALTLVNVSLAAQQSQPAPQPAAGSSQSMAKTDMMASCPMMSAMMRGPAAALHAQDALHLSSAQKSQLEAIKGTLDKGHAAAMDSMKALHKQINAIVQAPQFDERAARTDFDRMGQLHADMGLAMARAQHQVAGILTPQQESSLAALGQAKMGSMEKGGMSGMSGMAGMCAD